MFIVLPVSDEGFEVKMTAKQKVLVIGASGFLGGHLVKELIRQQYSVRVMVRASSNLQALAGLVYEKAIGDVDDVESMKAAMAGCDWVFHSAVNTSAWLLNSGPLYQTNVLGVVNAVTAAKASDIKKFVLTSSLVTVGKNHTGISTEKDYPALGDLFVDYMKTRFLAEKYVLEQFVESGFPAVACCVSNTYGPDDLGPTPHGQLIRQVALGRVPVYLKASAECVGVVDAAKALILAAEKGRNGERYIVSDRYMTNREIFAIAADQAGVRVPNIAFPTFLVYVGTSLLELISRLTGLTLLTNNAAKLMYRTWPFSHQKAVDELGWQPAPVENAIRAAIDSYLKR